VTEEKAGQTETREEFRVSYETRRFDGSWLAQKAELERFTPTAENINALPEPLRRYIHGLETRCDPAGDLAARICAEDNAAALAVKAQRLEAENRELREDRSELWKLIIDGSELGCTQPSDDGSDDCGNTENCLFHGLLELCDEKGKS
jgi:hypothetical protein